MSDYRDDVHCRIDPEQTAWLISGRRVQQVSVIMTDNPDRERGYQRRPSAITLRPHEARELAFELLVLAEHAERMEIGR